MAQIDPTGRRDFLKRSIAAGTALAAGLAVNANPATSVAATSAARSSASSSNPDDCEAGEPDGVQLATPKQASGKAPMETLESLPIVDTHQHLWDLSRFTLPWNDAEGPLKKNFVMADYLREAEGLNVVKTVYMEVDVRVDQQLAEADYVIDLCQKPDNPMVAAVISGRPDSASFGDWVKSFNGSPYIKGIRQVLHGSNPAGHCLKPEFVRGIKQLGENGLSFDLCMRSDDLLDAAKLVQQCGDTRFILDHCGNLSVQEKSPDARKRWRDGMLALAAAKNVVCKISGIIATAPTGWKPDDIAPNVLETIEVFGPDRIMFASDWPVCTMAATYRQWVRALRVIVKDRSLADNRKLFHDNAVAYYGLKDKST